MALGDEVVSGDGKAHGDDSESEVCLFADELFVEKEKLSVALISQDKLLKRAAHERREFKDKLEITLKELEATKKCVVVLSDEVECDECAFHMSSLTDLQSKYVALLDENDELKSRSGLLGACRSYSGLQSELAEKVAVDT